MGLKVTRIAQLPKEVRNTMTTAATKLPGSAPCASGTGATLTRDADRASPRGGGTQDETAHRRDQGPVNRKDRAFSAAMYDYCLAPKYWETF